MGGAIAVRVAAAGLVPTLVGLAVIDVVEGKCTMHCAQDGVACNSLLFHAHLRYSH